MSGFGYALVATPLLTLIFDTKSVVVINVMLACVLSALVLFHTRQHVDLKRMVWISLGSIPGIPLGAYLLSELDPVIIKLAIAVIVIPFSVLLLLGHTHHFKRDIIGSLVVGFTGGALMAGTSLGGPPIILFLLNQGLTKESFVGTFAAYSLLNTAVGIGMYASLGMITTDILIKAALFLPSLWLGSYLGIKTLPRVGTTLFRRIASFLVLGVALIMIVTVLVDLF